MRNVNSKKYTFLFVFILCVICACILSVLSLSLRHRQQQAAELSRYAQLLMSARILSHQGYFTLEKEGNFLPARFDRQTETLVECNTDEIPTAESSQILRVYQTRVLPRLTDEQGQIFTFADKGIDYTTYVEENRKHGYSKLPMKLFYEVLPNISDQSETRYGYVIPVNGFGLWDAIYGYLTLQPDADHILGITFYEQSETPGLGAEISESWWQNQFYNKVIFQKNEDGSTTFDTTALGIQVVKTTVENEMGNRPAKESAVDGISGATITSLGVSQAFRSSLGPYRHLLLDLNRKHKAIDAGD